MEYNISELDEKLNLNPITNDEFIKAIKMVISFNKEFTYSKHILDEWHQSYLVRYTNFEKYNEKLNKLLALDKEFNIHFLLINIIFIRRSCLEGPYNRLNLDKFCNEVAKLWFNNDKEIIKLILDIENKLYHMRKTYLKKIARVYRSIDELK